MFITLNKILKKRSEEGGVNFHIFHRIHRKSAVYATFNRTMIFNLEYWKKFEEKKEDFAKKTNFINLQISLKITIRYNCLPKFV